MLIRLTSDIHMEQFVHGTVPADINWADVMVPPMERDAESVLVMAGDICEFQYTFFYANAWKQLATRFLAVVVVPGNHEYCGGNSHYGPTTFFYYKELLRKYGKIYLLDNSHVTVEGVKFYGASLWTDYNENPLALISCMRMWDFRHGTDDNNGSPRLANTQDYVNRNAIARNKLFQTDAEVVITHFAPSHQSIHPRYVGHGRDEMNYHFVNDLDDRIQAELPHVKLWLHGHTHTQFDYTIGSTRVVCNPRGFPGEDTGHFAELDYIEI